jgi:hypothetical protein
MTIHCPNCGSELLDGREDCVICLTHVTFADEWEFPEGTDDVQSGAVESASTIAPASNSTDDRGGAPLRGNVSKLLQRELPGTHGLGGWLILPAISLVISPLLCVYNIFICIQALTGSEYQNSLPPGYSPTVLIACETTFFAGLICLNFLFYLKKRILPKCIIVFYIANLFVSFYTGQITLAFWAAVIWIPYFLMSRRVKATFVN